MKIFIALICLFASTLSFSQDGYHSYEQVKCHKGESCLVNLKYDHVIKLIPTENEEGQVDGARLSSSSFLSDTIYFGAKLCFQGSGNVVCSMMDLMSNGDGGHATITKFQCAHSEKDLLVNFVVEYDGYGKEEVNFEIKKCE